MALVLTEEEILLRETANSFFKDKSPVSSLRALRDEDSEKCYDPSLWAEMAEMGFCGVLIPEQYGGLGFGLMGAGIISQEMGRTLVASPYLSTAILGAYLINHGGCEAQKEKLLPKMAAGELITSIALEEKGASEYLDIKVKAQKKGNQYILFGEKTYVLDGMSADIFIVPAQTEEGISLFIIEASNPSVNRKKQILVDSRGAASVSFDNIEISSKNILGELGKGDVLLNQGLNRANLCLSAEMLGMSESVFAQTLDYLKDRTQFGVPIGSFQSLQHRASILFSELELAKSVVFSGLSAAGETKENIDTQASLAKAKLSEVARLATNEALQMHGGMGMTDEFDIGFYMKRARAIMLTFGNPTYHLDRFARLKGY